MYIAGADCEEDLVIPMVRQGSMEPCTNTTLVTLILSPPYSVLVACNTTLRPLETDHPSSHFYSLLQQVRSEARTEDISALLLQELQRNDVWPGRVGEICGEEISKLCTSLISPRPCSVP